MPFSDGLKEILDQGLAASKEFAIKAGAKAQDLGERGILMLEIKQMESQAQKILARLGTETYLAFAERGQPVIERDAVEFSTILNELANLKDAIETKEAELKNR